MTLSTKKINPQKELKSYIDIEMDSIESSTGRLIKQYKSTDFKSIKTIFSSDDVLYGKLRPYLRKYYKPYFEGVCSSEFWVFTSTVITQRFLYYFIARNSFNNEANKTCGTKMPRADWQKIKKLQIYWPPYHEQQKISSFFDFIDKKIILIQFKLAILKKYKEGILSLYRKKASQNGNLIKLSSICKLISGFNFSTDDYIYNGKFKVVTIGNVVDERYISGSFKQVNYSPNSFISLSREDLLISMTGNVGRSSYVNSDNMVLNQRVCKFECELSNKKFIYMITKTISFKRRMSVLAQGGAQSNLKNNDILNYSFYKIGDENVHQNYVEIYDRLDLILEQSKRLIYHLKLLKKALLNALFI